MKKSTKLSLRILSVLLLIALIVQILPTSAFADSFSKTDNPQISQSTGEETDKSQNETNKQPEIIS